jgi:hypothetical protein
MFDNPQDAIDKATELAYNSMVSALLSKEGKSTNKYNELIDFIVYAHLIVNLKI